VSRRRLHNTLLAMFDKSDERSIRTAMTQFSNANCMTDKFAALGVLSSVDCKERTDALNQFHKDAQGDALVLNKWFGVQAAADLPNLLDHVKALKSHPDFLMNNPNRARSLISVFAGNMLHFHASDGQGYKFIADCIIELDKMNGQVAARMATSFSQWRRFDDQRQALIKAELQRIVDNVKSKDTLEICQRCLK
jgi:aminopeptidase N